MTSTCDACGYPFSSHDGGTRCTSCGRVFCPVCEETKCDVMPDGTSMCHRCTKRETVEPGPEIKRCLAVLSRIVLI